MLNWKQDVDTPQPVDRMPVDPRLTPDVPNYSPVGSSLVLSLVELIVNAPTNDYPTISIGIYEIDHDQHKNLPIQDTITEQF